MIERVRPKLNVERAPTRVFQLPHTIHEHFLSGGEGPLALHLAPNRHRSFCTAGNPGLDIYFRQLPIKLVRNTLDDVIALLFKKLQTACDRVRNVGVQFPKGHVFELVFYLLNADTFGQGNIDIHRFPGDALAFPGIGYVVKGSHVVQSVGELYQQHPDILRYCQQQLAEILCIAGIGRLRFETRELGDTIDGARDIDRVEITVLHKANIMKKSDGMFLATAREVATQYPNIEVDECIVDALCMKLILHPEWFDVLLCGNLFGDIVSDLGAGLVGGRANCPSANIGNDTAIFTTGHRSDGPEDSSLVLSAILMLRHLGHDSAAETLFNACAAVLKHPKNGLISDLQAAL